jgi:adenylate cyclase
MILKSQFQANNQEKMIIVTMDDQSIEELGSWPWPREYHAQLITDLNQAGAKTIGFDILFEYPTENDDILVNRITQANNVIVPYKLNLRAYRDIFNFNQSQYKINQINYPIPELKEAATRRGYLNLLADHDGTIRRLHLLNHEEMNLEPFSISLAQNYSNQTREITADELLINFNTTQNYFQQISYSQVLQGDFPSGFFKDKLVLVGAKGDSFQDYLTTPLATLEGYLPGVMIHAAIIDNYLEDSFINRLGLIKTNLLILICSLLFSWLYYKLKPKYSLIFSGLSFIALLTINLSFFIFSNLFIPLLPLLLVVIINLIASLLNWYLKAEQRKDKLREVFSRYLAPKVVTEVLNMSDENYLEGQRKEITVLFIDINSFTNYAEDKSSQEVVKLLNDYFSLITEKTFDFAGTLDKFLGDGAMVFFNAPTDQPAHSHQAVKLAIELQTRIREDSQLPLSVSIGINTGLAIVGNVGSTIRSDYTAIGDVVNTAARLEGLAQANQIYLGDRTYQQVKGDFEIQLAEELTLRGKTKVEKVYKILY